MAVAPSGPTALHHRPKPRTTSTTPHASVEKRQIQSALGLNDKELRDLICTRLNKDAFPRSLSRGRFRDLVFTRQFSAFDPQNQTAANSQFHGFYTLFWLGVGLFMVKVGAENWRWYGNPLGKNDMLNIMFSRDVVVLLVLDGILCGMTGVSWIIQTLVYWDYLNWDREGWIIQNLWQTTYFLGVCAVPWVRDWPWTHTIFFILHGLVMLMKQHSYAFYNGYLSSLYKSRARLLEALDHLDGMDAPEEEQSQEEPVAILTTSVSKTDTLLTSSNELARRIQPLLSKDSATESSTTQETITSILSSTILPSQLHTIRNLLTTEINSLDEELRGKAPDATAYPHNITLANHYEYIVMPTVVYELGYPRNEKVDWTYVAEKTVALVGILFVMVMVSQAYIYPVVMEAMAVKDAGWTLEERLRLFPWIMIDLIFPLMGEYLMSWYVIWETVLNLLAEITCFADRSFYAPWWNSVSWDQFARDWNRPVHNFLLRHVYHSSITSLHLNRHAATVLTFLFSACVHEFVMACLFRKVRGYLLVMQMCQLPLAALSRTRLLKSRPRLGNVIFWAGLFFGPSILCSLYLIL